MVEQVEAEIVEEEAEKAEEGRYAVRNGQKGGLSHNTRHPKKAAMLGALARTGNISASARAAEIDRSTHYTWLRRDAAYAAAVDQAMEEAVEVLEAVARKRAVAGSDLLLMFLLKAAKPATYHDQFRIVHHQELKVDVSLQGVLTGLMENQGEDRALPDLTRPALPHSPNDEEE